MQIVRKICREGKRIIHIHRGNVQPRIRSLRNHARDCGVVGKYQCLGGVFTRRSYLRDEHGSVGARGEYLVDKGAKTVWRSGGTYVFVHIVGAGHEEDDSGEEREGDRGIGGNLGDEGAVMAFVIIVGHGSRVDRADHINGVVCEVLDEIEAIAVAVSALKAVSDRICECLVG